MKITKGKIILLVVVAYFAVFAVININKEKNYNQEILDKVVIVTDGKLDSKNEGKLVLVSGKVEYDELVTFLELEDFSTIKINRRVEDYLKVNGDNKWVERKEPLKDSDNDYLKQIVSEEKVANINIGEYVLDDKGLSLIPTDSYYHGQEKIGDLETAGYDYTRDKWEENLQVGDMKLTYKYYDLNKYPNISILAVQKGDSFVPYVVDKKTQIYQVFTKTVNTKAKLSKELDINVKKTTKGKILFIVMIIGLGIFLIVDNKKKAE